jgi:hypothetical protein
MKLLTAHPHSHAVQYHGYIVGHDPTIEMVLASYHQILGRRLEEDL